MMGCSQGSAQENVPSAAPGGGLAAHAIPLLHSFVDSREVYPESIAVDAACGTFFVGSVKEGTLYKGRVGTPGFEVFSPAGADGRTLATGLSLSNQRLVVAGRQSGLIFVYDTRNGRLLTRLDNGLREGQTFLSDVAFAQDGSAYVTDSVRPVLYRVAPVGADQYELQEFLHFDGTPVRYVSAAGPEGINVNGIVSTRDGRYLLLGKRNENALFRVDLQTREVVQVDTTGATLNTPDGMFLRGTTLYVAQNLPESIAVVQLSDDFTRATLERVIPHPTFAFPTSVARFRDGLLVVSSQFNTAGSPAAVTGTQLPVVPFWVTELPLIEPGASEPGEDPMAPCDGD